MSHHHLLQEAVALTLISGNDRIDRNAIVNVIGKTVPVAEVDSFGNLGDHNRWFIIFKSAWSKEKFLTLEKLKVNDQIFIIHKPYREVKLVRLLNIPPSISDDYVRDIAMKWGGTVISVECETLPRPYSNIKTFVRRIRMKFTSPDDEQNIPISIKMLGITIPVLLEGRAKVCYRCKQSGHTKSECTVLKCQVCRALGHDDIACTKSRLYANVAGASPNVLVRLSNATQGFNPTTASTKLYPKSKVCHKCKQPGHIKKDCILSQHGVIQTSTPLLNDDMDARFSTPTVLEGDIVVDMHDSAQDVAQTGGQDYVQCDDQAGETGDVQHGVSGDAQAKVQHNVQVSGEVIAEVGVKDGVQGRFEQNTVIEDPDMPRLAANDGRDEPVAVFLPDEQRETIDLGPQINNETVIHHQQPTLLEQSSPVCGGNDLGAIIGADNSLSDIEAYQAYKEGRSVLKRPLSDEQHPVCKDKKKQHQPTSPPEQGREIEDGEL